MKPNWIGIVKWSGDHYFSGDKVRGSKLKVEDNNLYIFDDELVEITIGGKYLGESARNVWVEVKEVRWIDE